MSLTEKIKYLRRVNSEALSSVLSLENTHSEASIAEAWLKALQSNSDLYPFGWYDPPPNGISVLIGNPGDFERLRFKSLRERKQWPRKDVHLSNDSLLYAYSSPIDRSSLLIGDICLTLYKGEDPRIQAHLRQAYEITYAIANYTSVGMSLKELYLYASKTISEAGLRNEVFSITDPCSFDIGHTIPWSYSKPSDAELNVVASAGGAALKKALSTQRVFLNSESTLPISETMAFTIEPRLSGANLPPVSFHVTVVFENGERSIIAGYDPLLTQFGMDVYLLLPAN